MKLHFEPNLDFQLQAIEAVCDLFRGQEICRTEFTVTRQRGQLELDEEAQALGIGNRLGLLDEEILANLRAVQQRNALPSSTSLDRRDFTVEMETGTGKTYVYLRTLLELHKRYGFNKFIIVVPSVAIREGVHKTIEITREHFRSLYAGVPFEAFVYDSTKLGQVRSFATSSQVQIMVVTVGAINKKDVNNLYKATEKTHDDKPIDLIRATRPIVVVDEPQSVDGGLTGAGKAALDAMNPLCTLRYSATHVDKHHMVYRLNAVDAYERRLVKQIEVAAATIEGGHNKPYVRLVSVDNRRGAITAKVELDVAAANGHARRAVVTVEDGDDLEQTTKRAVYANCRIGEIRAAKGRERLELRVPGGEQYLGLGEAWGDVDSLAVEREMIRRTIREHFAKEMRLRSQGIKVLSLFFIDQVGKYRETAADGTVAKGVYARIFEQEYERAARDPDFTTLFERIDRSHAAADVHEGYFSIDKRGGWTDTEEGNQASRDNGERAYNLIMRDKEKLLSFDTPLKFIFSHSALREGWDNPNVFQICALREMASEQQRRQTIGRGLRLAVNQDGQRVHGFEVNTLTVVARESYEEFAKNLQKEIESDTGIQFGYVLGHDFAGVVVATADGTETPLGVERSEELWRHLVMAKLVDAKGKVQDDLRRALEQGDLPLPPAFEAQRPQIEALLTRLAGDFPVKNADERRSVRTRQAVLHSPEFKALWDRIKQKTTYRVEFDAEALVEACTRALRDAPPVSKTRIYWRTADIAIERSGVTAAEVGEREPGKPVDESDIELPDVLTELQDRTQLTRRSILRILLGSQRLDDFKKNPQQFIQIAGEAINRCKRLALVDGVRYVRLGDQSYYAQELFESKELEGYLRNMLVATKSVFDHVIYQLGTERSFAAELERNSAIKVYAKLPAWFEVPTPLGSYTPDWAVLVEQDGGERVYFVAETKGSLFADDLRVKEQAKIDCGRRHFEAIATDAAPARYQVVRTVEDLLGSI